MAEMNATIPNDTVFIVEPKGAKFSVGLLANAGTGYTWMPKLIDPHTKIVTLDQEQKIPIGGPKPGGQVEFRFDFQAKNTGTVGCDFNLLGPDKKIVKTDRFDFVVT